MPIYGESQYTLHTSRIASKCCKYRLIPDSRGPPRTLELEEGVRRLQHPREHGPALGGGGGVPVLGGAQAARGDAQKFRTTAYFFLV